MILLTVIIPTHNPRLGLLDEVLQALRGQSLPLADWELLVIDNASDSSLPPQLVSWHPNSRVVREFRLGLTYARLCGIREARAPLLVWVDDDNILTSDYLLVANDAFASHPDLGAAGGPARPRYEVSPPPWFTEQLAPLGCRDHGSERILMRWDQRSPNYPGAAPIGAGMVIRRQPMKAWADAVGNDPNRLSLGRRGTALSSGEDNDINLTLLRDGWQLAYLPSLKLTHVIPAARLSLPYLKRMARASFRDFVRVLDHHGIRPWPPIPRWTLPLRALRSWIRYRVWSGPTQQVRWFGALGQYEGRASLSR